MMRRNLMRSIRSSLGRYIAIMAIIALGAGLFVGLLATKTDMIATGQRYMDDQNMFDLRLMSPFGWTDKELDAIKQFDEVDSAEGFVVLDVIAGSENGEEGSVYQLHSIPEAVNMPLLLGGRMPQAADECLLDGVFATPETLGTKLYILPENEQETLDSLRYHEYTVVGYVNSPLFMDITRGTTTLGNGSITSFVYIPGEAFDTEYYTDIYVTIPGEYEVYSDAYNDALEQASEKLEPKLLPLVEQRRDQLLTDARDAYQEGLAEYEDGLSEYEEGKQKAETELENALLKLEDGEKQISDSEAQILDGEKKLKNGQVQLNQQSSLLNQSVKDLEQAKADTYAQLDQAEAELEANRTIVADNLTQLTGALQEVDAGIAQLDSGITQLNAGIAQLEQGIAFLDAGITQTEDTIRATKEALEQSGLDAETMTQLQMQLAQAQATKDAYLAQRQALATDLAGYTAQLNELTQQRQTLLTQKEGLLANKEQLDLAMAQIENGITELENNRAMADAEFAAAEAQIVSAQKQLASARAVMNRQKKLLDEGKQELADAKDKLAEGYLEYEKGKAEAEAELADGKKSLDEAKELLDDAKEQIDSFGKAEIYILDRNTNIGYIAVDNNSDIVSNVSKVFPAFFLLVASLVCITTMTRMIEEERTQIGTLKALGYGNGAIIGKYMLYAGSAAVIGCGLGVFVGSIVFPKILWFGYSLILSMTPDVVIVFNIPLCASVVAVYTAVTLGVTWYCCRRSLREVPAELIRPKAPKAGKKIFLEYLPFWKRFSFLNKVMLRNIFRYRQRLLMMIIGVGGCTALLITGFGLGDSIVDIVSYQFEEVTTYDVQVTFDYGLEALEQELLASKFSQKADGIVFAHQSSVDVDFDNSVSTAYLVSSADDLSQSINFHRDKDPLSLPMAGEALISVGIAEKMGIQVGSKLTLRDPELKTLSVTVSGIFDNNVYNYVIVDPQTILDQWGEEPSYQSAFVTVKEGLDPHAVAADLSEEESVVYVMINQDIADQVGSMLEALNMIVATVVVCAGLLAIIVLYNLTNINITERVREIATIKVLGFNAFESGLYVFKENLFLSGMGTILGLFGGKLLLNFVMAQIRIDMVWFQSRVFTDSLIWSVVITMLMAVVVDFFLYFKLDKINMAEALKSVE